MKEREGERLKEKERERKRKKEKEREKREEEREKDRNIQRRVIDNLLIEKEIEISILSIENKGLTQLLKSRFSNKR